MARPGTVLLLEGAMIGRMTIPRRINGKPGFSERHHPTIQGVYDVISSRNGQGTTGQEIVLHIDHQKCLAEIRQQLRPIHHLSRLFSYHINRTDSLGFLTSQSKQIVGIGFERFRHFGLSQHLAHIDFDGPTDRRDRDVAGPIAERVLQHVGRFFQHEEHEGHQG